MCAGPGQIERSFVNPVHQQAIPTDMTFPEMLQVSGQRMIAIFWG